MGAYDASKCTVVVGGRFITGFEEGTMVTAEKDEEFFSVKADAQGEPIVSETNNPFGTVTLTLSQTSPSYAYLQQVAKAKEETDVWVTYNGEPKEKAGGTRARIKKTPAKEFGDEASSREFAFQVFDYTED